MCGPTITSTSHPNRPEGRIELNDKTDGNVDHDHSDNAKKGTIDPKLRRRGIIFGTISLTLVVVANSLLMGHKQSKMDQLGCDAMCVGSMTSVRSALTVIGSTVVGRCSDSTSLNHVGGARKFFLIVGAMALASSIILSAAATSLTAMWISLIPGALLQHNFNIMKAIFGSYHDATASASERASSVGMLGMAAGLGFMIGPPAGSRLCQTYEQASMVALCFLTAAMAVICFLLPNPPSLASSNESLETSSNPSPSSDKIKKESDESKTKPWWRSLTPDLVPAARTPPVIFLMVCRCCMASAFHIFNTLWMATLKARFGFGPKDYGTFFGYIGLVFAVSQGFVAKWVLNRFAGSSGTKRMNLLLGCCVILGGGRMLMYQTYNLVGIYVIYGFIITALGVVNTIFNADTSQIASPQELGGLFGVLASVETMAGIAGPVLGGGLTKIHPTYAPLTAVGFFYGTVFALIYWGYESIVVSHEMKKEREPNSTEKIKTT